MHPDEIALFNACITNAYTLAEVETLLKLDINVNKKSLCGRALLHWTAENNNVELTALLLNSKADIEIMNHCGLTPLHIAASCNSLQVIECLIMAGANIEAKDENGLTPLHWAAHKGYREAAIKLIVAGACLDSKNHADVTPIQLAFLSGHELLSRYLFNYRRFLCLPSSRDNKTLSSIEQHEETKNCIQHSVSCI